MSTATAARSSVVFDASAALRAAVDRNEHALRLFAAVERGEVDGSWPELALVEAGNALLRLARAGRLSNADALRTTARLLAAPVRAEPVAPLILPSFQVAAERALSVYDATYVVLAESRGAQLVTADRRLAAATEKSILIE